MRGFRRKPQGSGQSNSCRPKKRPRPMHRLIPSPRSRGLGSCGKRALERLSRNQRTKAKERGEFEMKTFKIAVIPGDGIGKEVVPEGLRVLEAAGSRFDLKFSCKNFDWSCETYLKTGKMMPDDGLEQLRPFDAIFLGAVGYPGVADHISLWGLLVHIRRSFQQYVNLRPVRLLKGIQSPLRNVEPGQIDFCVVRENNEGEYSDVGGRIFRDTEEEMAMQQTIFTRRGVDRILRYAFELARKRKSHVTSATKSNGIIHTIPF